MKLFEINQIELVNATKVIAKTIPEKALFPAQEYVHLKSFEGELAISASSSENTTRLVLESAIFDKPFDICIDHSFLKPLTKRDLTLTFSEIDNRCEITCKDSKWEVPMIDPNDFPEIDGQWEKLLTIGGPLLKDIIHKVTPFTYYEQGASISNIHFKSTDSYLCIGASNHFSCCSYNIYDTFDQEIALLVSRDTAALISDIITDDGEVSIETSKDNMLRFSQLDRSVACVRPSFEGNPVLNYYQLSQRYIDRDHDIITVVDKTYLKDQVKKAIAFSPFDMKSLLIHVLDMKLTIEVEDYMAHKRSVQEIEILMEQKGDVTLMALPYDHLMKMLNIIRSDSIEIEIPLSHGEKENCIKEPVLVKDQGYIFMIMPLVV